MNSLILTGEKFNAEYGQPKVVLIETGSWNMVIGSDGPTFCLYENGQIIYERPNERSTHFAYKYFEVKKETSEVQEIIKSLQITEELMNQSEYIDASDMTDRSTNLMILNLDKLKKIEVYGYLENIKSPDRLKTPPDFLTVYDNILKFDDPAAKVWLPDSIEVMATRYDNSPEIPLKWNNAWSDMASPTTVKRTKNLYSIYLDKKYFNEFIKLLESRKERQAVEINGGKYSLTYRFPFPNLN